MAQPKLPNVKTLEENEAELLNQAPSKQSNQNSQNNQNQFNNSKGPSVLNTLMQQHQSSGSPLNNQGDYQDQYMIPIKFLVLNLFAFVNRQEPEGRGP